MSRKQNCIAYLIICSVILLNLTACRKADVNLNIVTVPQQTAATPVENLLSWQEQYNLGVRYLSEGNYQEAIIAFTAAIEIDPKQAPAYVGRADAHIKLPQPEYESAEADYLTAVSLDALNEGVYLRLADMYTAIDEPENAAAILRRGYEATGSDELLSRIEELEGSQGVVTVVGIAMCNLTTFQQQISDYSQQYQHGDVHLHIMDSGIRFPEPIKVTVMSPDGTELLAEISEASVYGGTEGLITTLQGTPGPLDGKWVELTGRFVLTEQSGEIGTLQNVEGHPNCWMFRPNGPYDMIVESYRELD